MKKVTLLFLRQDNKILLAMKKRGFGAGLWNGVGGKVDPGETIVEATIRECQEEIGVTPQDIKPAGYLQFFMPDDLTFEHRCYIFTTGTWVGEPTETEEMRPEWFAAATVPYAQMWPDDSLWMPHLIAGELFSGTVTASEKAVVSHNIKVVPHLEPELEHHKSEGH